MAVSALAAERFALAIALSSEDMAAKTHTARSFEELWKALEDVPEGFVGEIVEGTIRTNPRPGPPHVEAASGLGIVLGGRIERRSFSCTRSMVSGTCG